MDSRLRGDERSALLLGGQRALLKRQAEPLPYIEQRFGECVDQRIVMIR